MILLVIVAKGYYAPDPADQEFFVLLHCAAWNLDPLHSQVGEESFVNTPPLVKLHADFIYDFVASPLTDFGFNLLRFVGPEVIAGQDVFLRSQAHLG